MNKAFTLIELMAVIILLGVLSLIAIVTINNTLKEEKENSCKIQEKNIISAAKNWGAKNVFNLPQDESNTIVTIRQLKDEGFLDKDIKNPKNDTLINDDLQIVITKIDNNYKYEFEMGC